MSLFFFAMGKILLVDDEASIRSAIREILEYEGYEVCEAGSGEQALKVAQEEVVVLALVDVKMAGMNGVETLEHLKNAHRFPVIMISAHATIDMVVDAIGKGAYDFISKPIDMHRLLISTRNAIEKVRLENEVATLREQLHKFSNH